MINLVDKIVKIVIMAKIRLTKIFEFDAAHALWNYDGKCKNIHGHTFRLEVTVIGKPLDKPNHPKDGMVMDYGDLKKIVKEHIIDKYDHFFIYNNNSPHKDIDYSKGGFEATRPLDFQPTSELMVLEFVKILKKNLPDYVDLYSVRLWETPTSYAEWIASDNI